MIVNGENKNGLKGLHNLAQGNPEYSGDALGWRTNIRIVRAKSFIKEKILFRTRAIVLYFPEIMSCNSVRKGILALFIEYCRTDFLLHSKPKATFRIVPPLTLPWAKLYWPFRPGLMYKE